MDGHIKYEEAKQSGSLERGGSSKSIFGDHRLVLGSEKFY